MASLALCLRFITNKQLFTLPTRTCSHAKLSKAVQVMQTQIKNTSTQHNMKSSSLTNEVHLKWRDVQTSFEQIVSHFFRSASHWINRNSFSIASM